MSVPGYPDVDLDAGSGLFGRAEAPERPLTPAERLIVECRARAWIVVDRAVQVDGWDPVDAAAFAALAGVSGAVLRIWRTATEVVRDLAVPDGTDIGPQIAAAVQAADQPGRSMPEGTGPVTWGLLARHKDPRVVRVVAEGDAPPEVLAFVAREHPQLALLIARNVNTAPSTLAQLAVNPDVMVRAAVAGHLAVPCDALVRLAREPEPRVRDAAERALARFSRKG